MSGFREKIWDPNEMVETYRKQLVLMQALRALDSGTPPDDTVCGMINLAREVAEEICPYESFSH